MSHAPASPSIASLLLAAASLLAGCATSISRSPVSAPEQVVWRHGLVIDASSSASTLFAYRWRTATGARLPVIESLELPGNDDCEPAPRGLGSYEGRPEEAAASLTPLFRCALGVVGGDPAARERATLLLRGTAGLREISDPAREEILERVRADLERLPLGEVSARVISGQDEGIFGWLTVNYLMGHLSHGGPSPTVGALDLGGASTQITFQPLEIPDRHGRRLRLGDAEYVLYSHSYLGLGQDRARIAVDSPACYLRNYPLEEGRTGTGDFAACREAIHERFARPCEASPCSIFGVHQPPVHGDFLAFSVYYYTARALGIAGRLTPTELAEAGVDFCAADWLELTAKDPDLASDPYFPNHCFAAAYVTTLLTEGWGFTPTTERVHALRRLRGTQVGWTLGALLVELTDGD